MLEDEYQMVLNLVQRLSTDEQFQLLEDLTATLRKESQPQHSILELNGSSTGIYRIVFSQVRQLSTDEQFRLLEDLAVILRKGITRKPKHRITELAGLGKEIWESIDVDAYIRESRGPHEPENNELKVYSSSYDFNQ